MAAASRVQARIQKALEGHGNQLEALEQRLITIEAMLDAMMTKSQRQRFEAALYGETEVIEDEPEEA